MTTSNWIRRFMEYYWLRDVSGGPRDNVEQPVQTPHDNEASSVNTISESNHHKTGSARVRPKKSARGVRDLSLQLLFDAVQVGAPYVEFASPTEIACASS
ncbi:unnamed protein product [Phytophthora fragariaefolia]|uniref:Unnamed protein product n=1 Tax=Phytophthora fragariaefolia TaxID=1490495 RepID=A0A9W7D9S3_9STRA|nr:unnamed protein product [Phytophthora fragariaefolia]